MRSNMKLNFINKPYSLTLWIILITTIIRFIIAGKTGLGIGEAYYFRGAMDLQLSYFDQPPLFFWMSGLSIRLFGYTNLALRIPAILCFIGTTWLLFLITKRFFSDWAGFFAVLILNISFVFTIPVATWFQPDAPLMFFWLLCTWFLIQILFPEKFSVHINSYVLWILVGISFGLATLSKYHAIFLLIGAFLFVLLNREYHHWIKHPGPYLALIINLVIIIPVIVWNYQNEWVSFAFQGSRAGSAELKLHFNWFIRSIFGQALWLAPWIWIPLILELVKSYKSGKANHIYSFIFWTAVLPIVFFTLVTLWSDTGFHFHWQAPGYLMLFIPLGAFVSQKWKDKIGTRLWLYSSAVLTCLIAVILIIQMNTGYFNEYGINRIVENSGMNYDPTIEGTDYDHIRERFEKEGWLEQDSLFAGTRMWWQVGKIDWALKGEKDVLVFHSDPRNHAFFIDPKELLGFDAIIVTQSSEKSINYNIIPFFENSEQLNDIEIIRNNKKELSLKVFYCKNFKIPEIPREDLSVYRQLINKTPF